MSTHLASPRHDDGDPLAPDRPAAEEASTGGDGPAPAVVVGADGTDCSLRAVRWAAEEAARRGAPLHIVHAAPYAGHRSDTGTRPPELTRARRIAGQAYTTARHAARDVPTTTEVVADAPADALLRAAATGQLLVVGIAATGATDELILARVAQKVVARSPQPVVVVPRRTGGEPRGRPLVVILGLGHPEDDEPVVEFAADAARRSRLPLSVVETRQSPAGNVAHDPERWVARFPDLEVRYTALPRVTPGELLSAIGPTPLVVMSAGHGSFLHRTLDGPHRWLLRHSISPMALVPPVHRPALQPRPEAATSG